MVVEKLKELLEQEKVKYVTISHSTAYTAQEIAASAHISGKEIAKTVMVKLDGKMAMAVVPATVRVGLDRLAEAAGAGSAELADEAEFEQLFPGCETGAMPPFGNLWGMPVYADDSLSDEDDIAFNAGTHKELVRMAYDDFERLVGPKIVEFAKDPTGD